MNDFENMKIFSSERIQVAQPETASIQIRTYLQFLSAKRQRYNRTNRVIAALDLQDGISLTEEYQRFNSRFQEINNVVNEALKENNVKKATESMKEFNEVFKNMESMYQRYKEAYSELPVDLDSLQEDIIQNYNAMIKQVKVELDNSRADIFRKIQEGIDDLLQLKKEYGITGYYKNKIRWEIIKTKFSSFIYFWLFIGTLALIPLLVGATFVVPDISTLKWYEAYVIRLSIAAPLLWIATFFHKNYSLRSVAAMKFDHLNRLLGGGAATIAGIVKSDEIAKAEVYKRLSELFLDMKDLSDIASVRSRPNARALGEAIKIVKDVKSS